MVTGKRFRLEHSTLALDILQGKRTAVTVPAGAILKVVSGPSDGERTVDILWEGRIVAMFAIDVDVRGTEIMEQSASA
ncbi:MAG: hypothetical protein JWO19_3098 [Bryobacterales bacterium]|jgi:hypothetical protein|nr:hypothetical protein [Bryobacterales bacterium]